MSVATQTQQTQQPAPPAKQFRHMLEANQEQIAAALPAHMDPARMIQVACMAAVNQPSLYSCDQKSIIKCVLECSQLGLYLDSVSKEAYLVPFGKTATLVPGYQGLVKLARQSGEVVNVQAFVVHEKDEFEYSLGLDPDLKHKPYNGEGDPGKVIAAYCVARLKDGSTQWDVMLRREIEAIRNRSKAGNNGPWRTDYAEMAKKTVFRRLFKWLPRSAVIDHAIQVSDRAEFEGIDVEYSEKPAATKRTARSELNEKLKPSEPTDNGEDVRQIEVDIHKAFDLLEFNNNQRTGHLKHYDGATSTSQLTDEQAKDLLSKLKRQLDDV